MCKSVERLHADVWEIVKKAFVGSKLWLQSYNETLKQALTA